MEPNQTPKASGFKAIYGIIIAILVVIGGFVFWNSKQNSEVTQTPAQPVSSQPSVPTGETKTPVPTPTPIVDNRKYKDGTYTATGTYGTPEGSENVSITLVIKNDKVTDATLKANASDNTSARYIDAFNQGFKTQVVGKSVDQISLTVVNGASLTPKGFMQALNKIKTQAQA